jgi:hypothetical protein
MRGFVAVLLLFIGSDNVKATVHAQHEVLQVAATGEHVPGTMCVVLHTAQVAPAGSTCLHTHAVAQTSTQLKTSSTISVHLLTAAAAAISRSSSYVVAALLAC